jgi:uncharacterized protein YndB with AHSA1/START domain
MMEIKNELVENPVKQQITITRVFNAPVKLVFSMWTNPEYMALWWGPEDFTNPVCEMDVQKGGKIKIVMQAPDGYQIAVTGEFSEIHEHDRIVFTTMKLDADGNAELEILNTVTLGEENGKTTLTMKAVVVKSTPQAAESLNGMETGWSQSLNRLADALPVIFKPKDSSEPL